MIRNIIMALLLMVTGQVWAADYYCAPDGTSGGNGTVSSPWDFKTAVGKLQSGDVLYCRGGQYDYGSTISLNCKPGTAGKLTTICAYPGEKPIFDFRKVAYGSRGITNSNDYICLKGLTIRYSGKNGLLNNGSYCRFENLDVYGNGDTGVQMKQGHSNLIINCDSHDNFDYELSGISAADFGGNADGFADKQYTGGGNHYIGCRAWNNSDDGWDFFAHVSGSGMTTIIENCLCYNNGPKEYDMRGHARYETDKKWFDQFQGNGIDITDNDGYPGHVSLEHYTNYGNGNGFKVGGNRTAHNVKVINCLAVGNTVKGFDQNNNLGTMYIYNNTGYANGVDFGFHNGESGGRLALRNNISYKSKSGNVVSVETVLKSSNSWDMTGYKVSDADFVSVDASEAVLLAERNADGSLNFGELFHLKEGSKLIDAGVNVGLPYRGAAPDLGYYEYGTGDTKTDSFAGEDWGNVPTPPDPTDDIEQCEKNADAAKVAYVTVPGSASDVPVLTALAGSPDFVYTVIDATKTGVDYSGYDMILIASQPSSSAAGVKELKTTKKPVLLLKTFMFKSGVWSWGAAANSKDTSVTVADNTHPVFDGLVVSGGGELTLFSKAVGDGAVTYISSFTSCSGYKTLATPKSVNNGVAIADLTGATMNGTKISQRYMMVGLSEYSMASMNSVCQELLLNACYYVTGKAKPTTSGIGTNIVAPSLNAPTYSLSGQRVGRDYRGVVISGGKKFMRK